MEKKFNSAEMPLSQLLDEAKSGSLQLPDFQRSWVWNDDHIASLLASISLSYPIGAVMTLERGNPDVRFRPRPLQGISLPGEVEPDHLLMDGQQRMTSLYLALASGTPVPTTDAKRKPIDRWYYADINACLDETADREDAIFGVPADGILRSFHNEIRLDVSTREKEIAAEMFPLSIVMDYSEAQDWQLQYFAHEDPQVVQERIKKWTEFNMKVVNAFVQYQVPTIQLVKSTPKEAVCQVFEKVNTGGVSLTVFELVTATYAADDFNLRDDWNQRKARFNEHSVLDRFGATDFLQVISLLATRQRALEFSSESGRGAPAISCKRKDVLRLSLEDYRTWADTATEAVEAVVPFLHGEHVFTARDLPYATQLVPLAAIIAALGRKAELQGVKEKLRRWYWSGVFGEMYGSAVEGRFANDLPEVLRWCDDASSIPRTVNDAQFQADRLLTLKTRQSAAYKGLYALQMKRGARDFRTGDPIEVHSYFSDAIDIHHIFPKKWTDTHGIDFQYADCVVNKTPIDRTTNQHIGGRAPSEYTERLQSHAGISAADLNALLQSHDIDTVALRQDDFETFFNRRFERLLKQIEEAMGKPVNRTESEETPFTDPVRQRESLRAGIETLRREGESKVVEFKSTGRKNLHTEKKDPRIEWAIVKTLAGFMNSSGGTLLVGVADDGSVVGIEQDYPFLKKPDPDAWELWLTELITESMGTLAATELSVEIAEQDGGVVARIDVGPAAEPVFAKAKGEKVDHFYTRVNNSTRELLGHDLMQYLDHRWR